MSSRDKVAKFGELANKRVNRVIKNIRLVGNLANKRNYHYSEEQARKIIKAIQKEVDTLKQSFENADSKGENDFRL